MSTRFQFQRFLSRRILKPKPFKFHLSCYSSSSNSTLKQDSVSGNDNDFPTGDFDFKPVTGFNKLLVKFNLLTADSSERVPHGSVLKIILRGQVFLLPNEAQA